MYHINMGADRELCLLEYIYFLQSMYEILCFIFPSTVNTTELQSLSLIDKICSHLTEELDLGFNIFSRVLL